MYLKEVNDIVDHLNSGEIGVIPSDTVYGLMCRAEDSSAVKKLYQLKHRENKPGTIITSSLDDLRRLQLESETLLKANAFWPNPVSVIVPCESDDFEYLHMGKRSLAVRIPNDAWLLSILNSTGPLLTSSANMPGDPTVVYIQEAERLFGDSVNFYVDGGDKSDAISSAVVRFEAGKVHIIRSGTIPVEFFDK